MFSFKNSYLSLKSLLLKAALDRVGAKIIDYDPDTHTYLVGLNEDSLILASLSEDGMRIQLETTLIFDSDIINLKTLSRIAHAAFFSGFAVTGISGKSDIEVKFYLGKEMDFSSLLHRFEFELANMTDCINQLASYLYYRSIQIDEWVLDLSMFDDIDLFLFNPQFLGEKKDFVYKDWNTYLASVLSNQDRSSADTMITAAELQACAKFEEVNELHLSEVGDMVLKEIIWNRKFMEMSSQGEYSIN